MQSLFYKEVHTKTVPSMERLLTAFPDGEIIAVSQPILLSNTQFDIGYKKITFQESGHRYSIVKRGLNQNTGEWHFEIQVSPHRYVQSVHPEEIVRQFVESIFNHE